MGLIYLFTVLATLAVPRLAKKLNLSIGIKYFPNPVKKKTVGDTIRRRKDGRTGGHAEDVLVSCRHDLRTVY